MTLHKYWPSACPKCPMRSTCTTSQYRRIGRWDREEVFDRVQQRLDRMPEAGKVRQQTVEHAFGTLKAWMDATHFQTKNAAKSAHGQPGRVMQMMGVRPLVAAIRAT